jgi:3-phytase
MATDFIPFNGKVSAIAQTGTVLGSGDVADDAAIWVNPADPTKSFIIGESKATNGGLHVFDLAGREVSRLATNSPLGNIDLRGDVVAAANRGTEAVDVFKIDATGKLTKLGSFATGMPDVYGFALGKAADGKLYAFASSQTGLVRQFDVKLDGGVSATAVRDIKRSAITEGLTVDDANGTVYIAEEDKGVYKYGLDPRTGQTNKTVDTIGSHGIVADLEGNAIYDAGGGKGYFVVSSQGNSEFKVYDRQTDAYLGTFKVDGVTSTDGMEISSANMGGAFGKGVLVVHDDSTNLTTSNYKIVPWESIQKLIGVVESTPTPTPTPEPTPTPTPEPTPTPTPEPTPTPTPTFSTASFTGTDGSELIVGNALDNTISGRGGHDTIYGGAGNDRIDGNKGDDVLHGGTGNDVFIIGSSTALNESILDFTKGQDKIDLGERDANSVTSGWQDFSFIGDQAFTKAGQLRAYQDAAKGITVIEGNTDSDLTAEMHIECKGLITFQASDFIL